MILQNLLDRKLIQKVSPPISSKEIQAKIKRAYKKFNFVQLHLKPPGFEEMLYVELYDAARLAGDALLLSKGYRATKKEGHHYAIFVATEILLKGKIKNEFRRIKRMRNLRHNIEYEAYTVSKADLAQAMKDVRKFLDVVKGLLRV